MTRYTYDVNEPEDFKELLGFWAKQEIHYPVFVSWHKIQPDEAAADFWLETELYRAKLTVYKPTPEEVHAVFSQKFRDDHQFIECFVYADDAAMRE